MSLPGSEGRRTVVGEWDSGDEELIDEVLKALLAANDCGGLQDPQTGEMYYSVQFRREEESVWDLADRRFTRVSPPYRRPRRHVRVSGLALAVTAVLALTAAGVGFGMALRSDQHGISARGIAPRVSSGVTLNPAPSGRRTASAPQRNDRPVAVEPVAVVPVIAPSAGSPNSASVTPSPSPVVEATGSTSQAGRAQPAPTPTSQSPSKSNPRPALAGAGVGVGVAPLNLGGMVP